MSSEVIPKIRVLVVDDDTNFLSGIPQYLSPAFFAKPETAPDSDEALNLLRAASDSSSFDVAIIDLHLPESRLQGLELVREIAGKYPEIAIIALTGDPKYLDRASESIENGAVQFIRKPIVPREFVERVRQARWIKQQQYLAIQSERRLLEQARDIQQTFLDIEPIETDEYAVQYFCDPARSVTGDFVDVRVLDDRSIVVLIGDAPGSGTPAALIAHSVVGCFRTLLETHNEAYLEPRTLAKLISKIIGSHRFSRTHKKSFNWHIRLLIGKLNADTGEFSYIRAGHEYPIVIGDDFKQVVIGEGEYPIGISDGATGDFNFQEETLAVPSGGRLVLYTDGMRKAVAESRFQTDEMIGNFQLSNASSNRSDPGGQLRQKEPLAETRDSDGGSGASAVVSGSNSLFGVDDGFPDWLPKEILENRILGGYELTRVLGRGGMGIVFEAYDPKLSRRIAIKVIQLDRDSSSRSLRKRFGREARVLASIDDPNVVTVYQSGKDYGIEFLAMEFVEGECLRDLIERSEKLSVELTLDYAIDIASGLVAVHQNSIIHRDIKPANIVIRSDRNNAVLIDFGLGKPILELDVISRPGVGAPGTILYMAAEQMFNEDESLDTRADIYSFGCVIYEMLTGKRVIEVNGKTILQISRKIDEGVRGSLFKAHDEVPNELKDLVDQMVRRQPADRPDSAVECLTRLRQIRDEYVNEHQDQQSGGEKFEFIAEQALLAHQRGAEDFPRALFSAIARGAESHEPSADGSVLDDDCTIVSIRRKS